MICDNGAIRSRFDSPDSAMSRLRRVFARLYRQQSPEPWRFERLATDEEITELTKTDLRRAA